MLGELFNSLDTALFGMSDAHLNQIPCGTWYTCHRHGWDCRGTPCPKCTQGDAPKHCDKHGWSHSWKPCPKCAGGQP